MSIRIPFHLLLLMATALTGPVFAGSVNVAIKGQSLEVVLGKLIFEDENLSSPSGQSCASCHQAEKFFADPGNAVSAGASVSLFGNRNAPSLAYVKFNPELFWNTEESLWMGGFFHDGRAKTLQEQAAGPFLNPLEMGNKTMVDVVNKVKASNYKLLVEQVYGASIWQNSDAAFHAITAAIVTYEQGPEFATFSSKYDYYLQGKVQLTAQEKLGLELFEAEDKGNCAACHPSQVSAEIPQPLFTDYSYDNIGQPANRDLDFYNMDALFNPQGVAYLDLGLANNPHIDNAHEEKGKFKVATLRNIAKTAPYLHNGVLDSLKEVVDFYNKRDVEANKPVSEQRWPQAEVAENINREELGDLKLTADEVDALVVFMETLTDGYTLSEQAAAASVKKVSQ
jgi:cytochrome c peroxidase